MFSFVWSTCNILHCVHCCSLSTIYPQRAVSWQRLIVLPFIMFASVTWSSLSHQSVFTIIFRSDTVIGASNSGYAGLFVIQQRISRCLSCFVIFVAPSLNHNYGMILSSPFANPQNSEFCNSRSWHISFFSPGCPHLVLSPGLSRLAGSVKSLIVRPPCSVFRVPSSVFRP